MGLTDLTKAEFSITKDQFDAAVERVKSNLYAESKTRSQSEPDAEKRKQLLTYNDMSIKTSLNFCELVKRGLFSQQHKMTRPEEERQGRISETLGAEDLARIHFHNTNWWFWNYDRAARIGPYDTSELAAQGLVSYEEHRSVAKSIERN